MSEPKTAAVDALRDEIGMQRLLNDAYARERGTDFGSGYAAGYQAAHAELAAKVAALEPFGEATHDADWGWRDCRNAVLDLLADRSVDGTA